MVILNKTANILIAAASRSKSGAGAKIPAASRSGESFLNSLQYAAYNFIHLRLGLRRVLEDALKIRGFQRVGKSHVGDAGDPQDAHAHVDGGENFGNGRHSDRVGADRARTATVPALELDVAAAAGGAAAQDAGASLASDAGPWVRLPGVQGPVHRWALATVAFALLWLLTLAWALQWRQRGLALAADAVAGAPAPRPVGAAASRGHGPALRKALDTGDLGDVAAALCALATPPVADLDALSARLAPGPQREAIAGLQRARWGQDGAGAAQARAAVRAAFARGPDWLDGGDAGDEGLLPPHYPR